MSNDDLLKLLEAHGQQFMQSFDVTISNGKRKHNPLDDNDQVSPKKRRQEASEEEWEGIGQGSDHSEHESSASEDIEDECEAMGDDDDDFIYESTPHAHQPAVVVFSETGKSAVVQRGSKTGFMSSKVTKLTQDVAGPSQSRQTASDEDEDDLTNTQNDALLHRLVHTQLLSGSLNPDLNLTPAQRKKALAGRVMEAAGKAKLGKGEAVVRHEERNRAAKHVRDGLHEKQKARQKKELEEAKHLGNYHPTLKALYEASSDSKPGRKRERGLKMGVGSFKGGTLRLSKNEISAVEGRGGSGGRRRGGGRGRGGKR